MKRITSIVLILALSASLFLFSGASAVTKSSPKKIDLTPETFTVFIPQASASQPNWDDAVAKEITKKTGVILKYDVGVGDPMQKIALMEASGQYPDLILNQNDSMTTLVKANGLIKLDSLIDTYGPNIKKFYGSKYNRLKLSSDNPHIYGFGTGGAINNTVPGYYWNIGFQLQIAALKEQKYPKVSSLKDYENIIKAYVAKHPTIDGKKTIGMSLITSDGWRYEISLGDPASYTTGIADNAEWYVDEKSGKVIMKYETPGVKTYFQWLNHMYNIGLLDPETFTQDYNTYLSKISSGRVVGLADGLWEINAAVANLKDAKKFDKTYVPFPILQNPKTQKWMAVQSDGSVASGGFSITTACKNPEKIVNFFNYLAGEEGQILKEWGILGVNYDIVNGKRVRKPDQVAQDMKDGVAFTKATGVKLYARGVGEYLQHGYGAKDSKGQLISSEDPKAIADQSFTVQEKNILQHYKAKTFTDLFPQASDFPDRAYGSAGGFQVGKTDETKVDWKKAQDCVLKDIAAAVLCKPEQFNASWQNFMNDLKDAGIQKVEAEMTQQYKDTLKFWK